MAKHRGGDGFLKTVTESRGRFYPASKEDRAARDLPTGFENQAKPLKPPQRSTGEHVAYCKCINCLAKRNRV